MLTRVLKRRSHCEDVSALQNALEARGFSTGGIDQDFGSKTERAVKAFQLKAGLTEDGQVGPDMGSTRRYLQR